MTTTSKLIVYGFFLALIIGIGSFFGSLGLLYFFLSFYFLEKVMEG